VVKGTHSPLTIQGQAGLDTVQVGNSTADGVQQILGPVTVKNTGSYTALTVTDATNTQPRNAVTLGATSLAGLAPAPINWVEADLKSLTINGGSAGDTFTVMNTPWNQSGLTILAGGGGADTIQVQKTTWPLTVQGGSGNDAITLSNAAGTLQDIQGAVTV